MTPCLNWQGGRYHIHSFLNELLGHELYRGQLDQPALGTAFWDVFFMILQNLYFTVMSKESYIMLKTNENGVFLSKFE